MKNTNDKGDSELAVSKIMKCKRKNFLETCKFILHNKTSVIVIGPLSLSFLEETVCWVFFGFLKVSIYSYKQKQKERIITFFKLLISCCCHSIPSGFYPDDALYQCITSTTVIRALIAYALLTDTFITLLL